MLNLQLSIEEINQLLSLLGEQPIKSGLNDLTNKIKKQGEEQLKARASAQADNNITDVVEVA